MINKEILARNSWEFLKDITDDELKQILSKYNKDKGENYKEFFEIESYEDEFRIELYNVDIKSGEKVKIAYIDFLSDFSYYSESICEENSYRSMTTQFLKLFIRKFGNNYVEKFLEDYKTKLKIKVDKIYDSLFELRTFSSLNLFDSTKGYNQAKNLHEEAFNCADKISQNLYNKTRKALNQILNESEN